MKQGFLIFLLILITSCSTIRYVPVETVVTETKTEIVRDTIIQWTPPVEKIVNETRDTTSTVETSLAKSTATITDGILHHEIENKKDSIKTKIVYKDKEVVKTEFKEVPVPVEVEKRVVPGWCKRLLAANIIVACVLALYLFIKLYFKRI